MQLQVFALIRQTAIHKVHTAQLRCGLKETVEGLRVDLEGMDGCEWKVLFDSGGPLANIRANIDET
jgi:hypothetical protein